MISFEKKRMFSLMCTELVKSLIFFDKLNAYKMLFDGNIRLKSTWKQKVTSFILSRTWRATYHILSTTFVQVFQHWSKTRKKLIFNLKHILSPFSSTLNHLRPLFLGITLPFLDTFCTNLFLSNLQSCCNISKAVWNPS